MTLGLCDEVGLGKTHVAADAARRLLKHDFRLAIYVSPNLTLAQQNRSKIASTMVKPGARQRTRYRTAESRLTLLLPAALVGLRGGVLDLKELSSARENRDPSESNGRASRVVLVSAHTSLHLAGKGLRRERDWLRVLLQWYRRRYATSRVERSRINYLVRVIAECDHGLKSGGSSVSAFARLLREQPRRRRSRIGKFVRKWLVRVDKEGEQPSIRQIREAYRQQLLGEIGPILWLIDEYQQYPELFRKLKRLREKSRDAFILMSATPFEVPEDPDGAMRHEGLRDFLALVDERLAKRMFGTEGGAFESHWDSIRTLVEQYRSGALDEDGVRGRVESLLNDDVQPLQRQLTRCLIRHERPHLSVRGDGESALDDWQPWLTSYGGLERLSAHVSPAAWTTEMWNHSPSFPLTSGAVDLPPDSIRLRA